MLSHAALAAMREHGFADLSHECGGVMVGHKLEGDGGPLVLVEAVISGAHTDARRGSVTFTHETWEQINQEKDQNYPDLRVVGWYHTHPGFGIFLSDYDQFIQKNFFDLPWNVAFVLDPRSGESGVFGWQEGELLRLPSYELYGDSEVEASAEAAPVAPLSVGYEAARRPGRNGALAAAVFGVVVIFVLVLGLIALGRMSRLVGRQLEAARKTAPAAPAPAAEYTWHTVQPGETAQALAQHYYGRDDMAGLIVAANGLTSADQALPPGMLVRVPLPPSLPAAAPAPAALTGAAAAQGGETTGGGRANQQP
jgi:proteasome lid subunit RPN8/RPN11/phage tail protein X